MNIWSSLRDSSLTRCAYVASAITVRVFACLFAANNAVVVKHTKSSLDPSKNTHVYIYTWYIINVQLIIVWIIMSL